MKACRLLLGLLAKLFLITISVFIISETYAADFKELPNGNLVVAYRQLSEGKLSESIHEISLLCASGQCSITTLTVNQCWDSPEGKSFHPKIERTSTEEGNLIVIAIEKGVIEVEERYSAATFKYRFKFTTSADPSFSARLGIRGNLWFKDLIGFSGAVVKQSDILNKVISWECVPLKGAWVSVKPCGKMMLRGIPDK
jgi:hypothetical protein